MKRTISCIVPAYNEAKTIGDIIAILKHLKARGFIAEIIVVSDGSRDDTAAVAEQAGADLVFELPSNEGKAAAVIEGLGLTKGDIILLVDGDLIGLTEQHIIDLLAPVTASVAKMTIGYLTDDSVQQLLPNLSGQRAVERSVLEPLLADQRVRSSRYQFELLVNKQADKSRLRVQYVPLKGLSHIRRWEKYSIRRVLIEKLRFTVGVMNLYKLAVAGVGAVIVLAITYLLLFGPSRTYAGQFPLMPEPTANERILEIAAHPDDEILGAGGYLADAVSSGAEVTVVIVTSGDANRLGASIIDKTPVPQQSDFINEARRRMDESRRALSFMGVLPDHVKFISFPDRVLPQLIERSQEPFASPFTGLNSVSYEGSYKLGTPYTGSALVSQLTELVVQLHPDTVITHHPADTNADHRTVSLVVDRAIEQARRADRAFNPRLYRFLIHWKLAEYPHPFRSEEDGILLPPKELANEQWLIYPLSRETESLTRQAISSYGSQLKSPYLHLLLEAFVRSNELFEYVPS